MTPETLYLLLGAGLATVLILAGQWAAAASRRRDAVARRADLAARRESTNGRVTPIEDAVADDVRPGAYASRFAHRQTTHRLVLNDWGQGDHDPLAPNIDMTEETR